RPPPAATASTPEIIFPLHVRALRPGRKRRPLFRRARAGSLSRHQRRFLRFLKEQESEFVGMQERLWGPIRSTQAAGSLTGHKRAEDSVGPESGGTDDRDGTGGGGDSPAGLCHSGSARASGDGGGAARGARPGLRPRGAPPAADGGARLLTRL